jgi:hypothetical protein
MSQEVTLLTEAGRYFYSMYEGKLYYNNLTGASLVNDYGITQYHRPAAVRYQGGYFFISEYMPLDFVQDGVVADFNPEGNIVPQARHAVVFRDHLILGNVTHNGDSVPQRLLSSDLRKFGIWDPAQGNEAVEHDLTLDQQVQEHVDGVTGLMILGQNCVCYTGNQIFAITYVGLPTVYTIQEVYNKLGNCFPFALVGNEKFHIFVSDENFYLIGEDFQASLRTSRRTLMIGIRCTV